MPTTEMNALKKLLIGKPKKVKVSKQLQKRFDDIKSGKIDMSDKNNWKATYTECGGTMDYYNLRYCCRKCGNMLEV